MRRAVQNGLTRMGEISSSLASRFERADNLFVAGASRTEQFLLDAIEELSLRALSLIPAATRQTAAIVSQLAESTAERIGPNPSVLAASVEPAAQRTASIVLALGQTAAQRGARAVSAVFGQRVVSADSIDRRYQEIGETVAASLREGFDDLPVANALRNRVQTIRRLERTRRRRTASGQRERKQ